MRYYLACAGNVTNSGPPILPRVRSFGAGFRGAGRKVRPENKPKTKAMKKANTMNTITQKSKCAVVSYLIHYYVNGEKVRNGFKFNNCVEVLKSEGYRVFVPKNMTEVTEI